MARWNHLMQHFDDPEPTTAEQHRREAIRLLHTARGVHSTDALQLAKAQVHATLAITAPAGEGEHP
jgi:hypothetical protein